MTDKNLQEVFTKIYDTKFWYNGESLSGAGSNLAYTENLRKELPKLFDIFNIKTVLDAPCGDMNWMRLVLAERKDIDYTGGDIVPPMIELNQRLYGNDRIRFEVLDITTDELPAADLMICRDCLFHLPEVKIYEFLDNFLKSNIKYLLTTTHEPASGKNEVINPGEWFKLDLLSPPYNFSPDARFKIVDWIPGENPRHMYLWDKNQIASYRATYK